MSVILDNVMPSLTFHAAIHKDERFLRLAASELQVFNLSNPLMQFKIEHNNVI